MSEEIAKKKYIIHYALKPDIATEENLHQKRESINGQIEQAGGQIEASLCQENVRRLAYPIDKIDRAYMCESVFSMEPQNVQSLSENLKHDNTIIRYIIEAKDLRKPKKQSTRRTALKAREEKAPIPPPITQPEENISHQTAPQQILEKSEEREKISMEELDKKLEEIIKNI